MIERLRQIDAVNLGACFVTVANGVVTAVTLNGTPLPIAADAPDPPDRGTVKGTGQTDSK